MVFERSSRVPVYVDVYNTLVSKHNSKNGRALLTRVEECNRTRGTPSRELVTRAVTANCAIYRIAHALGQLPCSNAMSGRLGPPAERCRVSGHLRCVTCLSSLGETLGLGVLLALGSTHAAARGDVSAEDPIEKTSARGLAAPSSIRLPSCMMRRRCANGFAIR